MGNIVYDIGCDCLRKKEISEEISEESDRVKVITPNSLEEVKIKTENFVKKRTLTVYSIYEKILLLGKTPFSEVYKVQKINGNEIRIIKEISKSSLEDTKGILNEIEILKKLDHPNIIKIFEYFEDPQMIYIVEDFSEGGELADKMDKYGVYCEFLVKYIMYHVFLALTFLHNNSVIHGDIKRENILLSFLNQNDVDNNIFKRLSENKEIQEELIKASKFEDLSETAKNYALDITNVEVLLGNFGSAKIKKKSERSQQSTGTISNNFYSSPERIEGKIDYECDEWACGVLMYIILSGEAPFNGSTEEDVLKNIVENDVDFNIDELKHISDSCKDLMSKLLIKKSEERIKASEALKHDFFQKGINILKLMEKGNKTNVSKLSKFAMKTTIARSKINYKRCVFREAVIAYMALNFTDKEEANQIKGIFRELAGDNPKYEITKETFIEKMKNLLKDYTTEQLSDLFDTLDNDLSGKIEYEELIRALGDESKLLNEKNLKEAFDFFDENKNGHIAIKEISNIVFKGKDMPPNILQEFLEEIDLKDEKTEISFEKFLEIMGYKNLLK